MATATVAFASTILDPVTAQPKYRRCTCEGVLPGRACSLCFSTGWLKRCPHCFGSGTIYKNSRAGEPRPEPCVNCRRGWQAAMPADLREMREHTAQVELQATPELAKHIARGDRRKQHHRSKSKIVATPAEQQEVVTSVVPPRVEPFVPIPVEHVAELPADYVPNPAAVIDSDSEDFSYQDLN